MGRQELLADLEKTCRLFKLLDDRGRELLLDRAERRRFCEGEVICREGEPGDELFVILSGSVRVSVDDFGEPRELAIIERGGFFGEMAVLTNQRRNASVAAVVDTELLCVKPPLLLGLVGAHPWLRQLLGRVAVKRAEQMLDRVACAA